MNKTIILKLHENTDRSQVKKTIINCSAQAGHKTLYMKSDPNLSSMLFFVLFFFYEARQALRQNKAHEYNSSTNIVDHADGSSNNNYQGGGSSGGNSSHPLAPHSRGRGHAGYLTMVGNDGIPTVKFVASSAMSPLSVARALTTPTRWTPLIGVGYGITLR
jgi:hypothetical protein